MDDSPEFDRERFWAALVVRYAHRFDAWLARSPYGVDERNEIAWDAWQLAVERERQLVGSSDHWALLSICLREACRDRLRSLRHERAASERDLSEHCSLESLDSVVEVSHDELCDEVLIALGSLSQQQRDAVDYRYRWGWPYEIVAAALNCKEATARVQAKRGLDRLRALFSNRRREWTEEGLSTLVKNETKHGLTRKRG